MRKVTIVTAIRAAPLVLGADAAAARAEKTKEQRQRCPECGEYDCDPDGVGHYRG